MVRDGRRQACPAGDLSRTISPFTGRISPSQRGVQRGAVHQPAATRRRRPPAAGHTARRDSSPRRHGRPPAGRPAALGCPPRDHPGPIVPGTTCGPSDGSARRACRPESSSTCRPIRDSCSASRSRSARSPAIAPRRRTCPGSVGRGRRRRRRAPRRTPASGAATPSPARVPPPHRDRLSDRGEHPAGDARGARPRCGVVHGHRDSPQTRPATHNSTR